MKRDREEIDAGARAAESAEVAPRIAHGGDLSELARRYPAAPWPYLDLSTGINPLAYPLAEMTAETWSRLPQHDDVAALEAAASERYGVVSAGRVVAASGSQALIQVLPRLLARANVAILGPTYEEHARAFGVAGHSVRVVDTLEALRAADVAVIVNPNNPTGHLIPPQDILRLADDARAPSLIVVDEAFMDYVDLDMHLAPRIADRPIVVLRSFGKAYGLAGVRLGFAVIPVALTQLLRNALGPWPVSGPAIAIGQQALADADWLASSRQRIAKDMLRLDTLLQGSLGGTLGVAPLFRLAVCAETASVLERLGNAGIWVRRFPGQPHWLRFGLPGSGADWARLEAALAAVP